MRYLLTLFLSFSAFALEETTLEGTLFKKNDQWFLFVEDEKASFKKGTVELKDIPSSQKKLLIEKAYVQVSGKQDQCLSKKVCVSVRTLKPALLDPLKGRSK